MGPAEGDSFSVEAPEGAVAAHPELFILRLADIAEIEGADRSDWLAKAADAARPKLEVGGDPRYQFVRDLAVEADAAFQTVLASLTDELTTILGGTDARRPGHVRE